MFSDGYQEQYGGVDDKNTKQAVLKIF